MRFMRYVKDTVAGALAKRNPNEVTSSLSTLSAPLSHESSQSSKAEPAAVEIYVPPRKETPKELLSILKIMNAEAKPDNVSEKTWYESILQAALLLNNFIDNSPNLESRLRPQRKMAKNSVFFLATLGWMFSCGYSIYHMFLVCNAIIDDQPRKEEEALNLYPWYEKNCPEVYNYDNVTENCTLVPYASSDNSSICPPTTCHKFEYIFKYCTYLNMFDHGIFSPGYGQGEANVMNQEYGACINSIYTGLELCSPQNFSLSTAACDRSEFNLCQPAHFYALLIVVSAFGSPYIIVRLNSYWQKKAILDSSAEQFLHNKVIGKAEVEKHRTFREVRAYLNSELQLAAKIGFFDPRGNFIRNPAIPENKYEATVLLHENKEPDSGQYVSLLN